MSTSKVAFIITIAAILLKPAGAQVLEAPLVPILTGQVVNQDSQPIVADVRLVQAGLNIRISSTPTDSNGWFSADGWPSTPVEVRITAEGYTSERVELEAPGPWPPLVLRLRRSGVVAGVVVDQFGIPLVRAAVAVEEEAVRGRRVTTLPKNEVAFTRDDGAFTINVPTGRRFRLQIAKERCAALYTEYLTLTEGERLDVPAPRVLQCSL